MTGKVYCEISTEPLNPGSAISITDDPSHGASSSFIGKVRNHNLGKEVSGVSYDVYEELALSTFSKLCDAVHKKWGNELNIFISHYKGKLDIGGISIILVVSSPHRREAFEACRYLIEEIKHQAPIWKQEHYIDGDSDWVQGHALCQHG